MGVNESKSVPVDTTTAVNSVVSDLARSATDKALLAGRVAYLEAELLQSQELSKAKDERTEVLLDRIRALEADATGEVPEHVVLVQNSDA